MVRVLTWVVVAIVAFTLGVMALQSRGRLPESIRVSGPIITVHTKRGRAFLDWLATPKRAWRAWGNFGVGIALVIMVGTFLAVLTSGLQATQQAERTAVQNPQNVLVIPGVNDFLPLDAAPEIVLGLLVGLIVHEGGHGLLCRVEDIEIDSMGLALFSFIPIGAFVEPDEESRNEASRGSQTRMFAAGVTNNFFVTFLAFLLLFGPISGSIAVASGVPVGDSLNNSPAEAAGLEYGDRVTAVEGTTVANQSEFERELDRVEGRRVELTLADGETVTAERSLLVTRIVDSVAEGIEWSRQDPPTVERVNGTEVYTERQLADVMRDRTVARVETTRGNATFPVGAYVHRIDADGPLEPFDLSEGSDVIVTEVGGERTPNATALDRTLEGYDAGATVSVTLFEDGERRSGDVTLDEDGGLGVETQPGYSGLAVSDMGIHRYPAELFLAYLGGGAGPLGGLLDGSFLQRTFAVLLLPFFSTFDPAVPYNFAGFLPTVTNFYTVTGPLSALGSGVFVTANALFWIGWVNLNLGLFNCIPTFPLDGGHIFRASAESLVARLPLEGGRRLTTAITASVSIAMLAGLVLMLFGPELF